MKQINGNKLQVLRDWFQDTLVAEEHFFPTLATIKENHNGEINQDFDQLEELNSFKMRKTFWREEYKTCQGQVCTFLFSFHPGIYFSVSGPKRYMQCGFRRPSIHSRAECIYYEQV